MSTIKLKPDKTLLCPTFDGYKLTSASGQFTTYTKPLSDGLCCSSRSDNSSYLYTRLDALHNCLIPEIASGDDSSYSTVYCFNRRGQLLAYDYSNQSNLCPSRVVWHADLAEDAAECPSLLLPPSQPEESASLSDSASLFGWLRPTLVLASPSVAVASDGRRHVSILHTGNRNTEVHHTWTTVLTVSVGSCEVADARVVHDGPDNALLHVLLVAVVPPALLPVTAPPMLSSAPSLHLLTWLTISIENGKAYKVQRERLFAGTAALEYYQLDVSCSAVMLLTHKLYMQLRDSACPEVVLAKATLPSNKTDEEAKNKRLFLFQQTDDDVTIRVSTATSTSSENMLITVSSSELCVGLRVGEVLLKGTFLHAVDPNTATWTVESGRVEINVCKSITGQRWESLLQELDLRGEEEDMFQETDPLAHLTSETWGGCNGRDEKPAFHPGELESCDDADSDLLLLVLEAEGHSSKEHTPRAYLGNTQYLATIPTECGLPSLFCVRHDVDGVVWRVGQQLPKGAEDCFTHTATFNAFGYVRAGKTMAKYTSAPPDCSFVAVCDVRSHVYLFCQPSPLGGELKNRRTGKVTSNVARQLLLSLPSHDEVMGFVAFSSVLFVCTASDVYAYALALSNA